MITGNGLLSLRKKDLENQKTPTVGFRKTVFAHKASAGQTGFNLQNLTTPTELTANGFSQPSVGELQNANLLFYRNNLKLISSARGVLIDFISYTLASSTQINFLGFTALEGEIFYGVIDYNAQTGLKVVDASPIIATGTLAATQTDFNVGTPFKVGQYASYNVGAVLVYVDRVLQQRNTSNSSTSLDKDYYEVESGAGLGSIIRFNTSDPDVGREITVVSNGLLSERPDGSMMAVIESLSGYVDNITGVVAQLAGLTTSSVKGAAPTNVDLKNFGDKVYTLEGNRARVDTDNTWTAPQSLVGRTNGVAIPAGQIGEILTFTNPNSITSVGANSPVDVYTFTLQPGKWELIGSYTMSLNITTSGIGINNNISGTLSLTDNANALVTTSGAYEQQLVANGTAQSWLRQMPIVANVDITTATTYKLRIACNQASAGGVTQALAHGASTVGISITSKMQAKRIG